MLLIEFLFVLCIFVRFRALLCCFLIFRFFACCLVVLPHSAFAVRPALRFDSRFLRRCPLVRLGTLRLFEKKEIVSARDFDAAFWWWARLRRGGGMWVIATDTFCFRG